MDLLCETERQQREEHGQRAGADAGDEIELQEVASAPDAFQLRAEHPQRQHVEQNVEQPAVEKHVRPELPDPEVPKHEHRMKPEHVGQDREDELRDKYRDGHSNQYLQCRRDRSGSERKRRSVWRRISAHAKVRIVPRNFCTRTKKGPSLFARRGSKEDG